MGKIIIILLAVSTGLILLGVQLQEYGLGLEVFGFFGLGVTAFLILLWLTRKFMKK